MLNRFYYLEQYPVGEETNRQAALDADIPIAHLVDSRPGSGLELLDHHYSEQGNYPFCLALHDTEEDPIQTLHELLLFFFHPFHHSAERGKPLFIFAPPEKEADIRQQAEEFFARQRLQIELLFIKPSPAGVWGAAETVGIPATQDHDPAGDYYRYCLSSWSPEDVFLLHQSNIEKVIHDLQDVMAHLKRRHPAFATLANESIGNRERLARLERDNALLQEENATLKQLMELSSKHNEVDYILRFYKNEYEILPLWYKRFGHIIKVLQGKRSFRSLYDKTAKKYKD